MKFLEGLSRLSLENTGLYYRLTIIFAFFFFAPLLAIVYFILRYNLLGDELLPFFGILLLSSSLAGYVLIRRSFDDIRRVSQNLTDRIPKELTSPESKEMSNELKEIFLSFQALERGFRTSLSEQNRRLSQISTLKEVAELCYVTFERDDLFAVTLERALKIVAADVGSVMLLEGGQREAFVVNATYGLGDIVKKGDRVDFATSIAKFAVINKSPILVDDIEKDMRFGRNNRPHYATKAFVCMPLKGIKDVFGVVTVSRREEGRPFTQEDVDVLTPLLSNAAFTYENLKLMAAIEESGRLLETISGICRTLGSSLRNRELIHAILQQLGEAIPFDAAFVLALQETNLERSLVVLDLVARCPLKVRPDTYYDYRNSLIEGAVRQASTIHLENPSEMHHPLEKELFVEAGFKSILVVPLKMGSAVTGVLALASSQTNAFAGSLDKVDSLAPALALALEKNRLSSSISKRDKELETIKQIGGILAASTFEQEEVLKSTMDMIRTIMNVEAGSLLLLEGEELAFKVSFNMWPEANLEPLQSVRLKIGEGIAGYAAARGEPQLIRDAQESRLFTPHFDEATGFRTRSVLCVPLISRGKVLGVIEILNKIGDVFNEGDLHLLQSIATSVSIALENSRLYQETLSMAEHERSIRNVFQKFVPREIVDKIIHTAKEDTPLLEETKILTFLNIDIRGFSSLSHSAGPQRTVAMLNAFFERMGEVVFRHGGIVDKYLGDGFLAIFGAPISSVRDADNAVAAALEMKEAMLGFNDLLAGEFGSPLSIGISIHTGEAVVGNIGFDKKMDYTVIGDSVNVVFRLQELTKEIPNGIVISEKTRLAAMDSILTLRELADNLAGDMGELKVYELLGSRPRIPSNI